ncbi:MAG: hypothetical protein H7066_06035, partial [Cytophagaceae bacterium]|nr:hypothetical protein [Gemmatimonadaceae bacterium]
MLSRRRFAELLTLSSSALLLPRDAQALDAEGLISAPLPRTPLLPDERYWQEVRAR